MNAYFLANKGDGRWIRRIDLWPSSIRP